MIWLPPPRILLWLVTAASLLALVAASVSGYRSAVYARCQAQVNDAVISAQRAQADAVDQMVTDVLEAKVAGDTRRALERYRQARAAHPMPPPASEIC